MDKQKIEDKIKKLLRLATSANVNEAAAAAGQAQALIEKYNIDLSMAEAEGDDGSEPVRDWKPADNRDIPLFVVKQRMPTWRWSLAWSVAEVNGCKPWSYSDYVTREDGSWGWQRTAYLVGDPRDAAHAAAIYQYIEAQIDALCKRKGAGMGRAWANSFRMGAASEIGRRLEQASRAERKRLKGEAEGEQALVRVEAAIARLDERGAKVTAFMEAMEMSYSSGGGGSVSDGGGYSAGVKAGRSIKLGGGSTKALKS